MVKDFTSQNLLDAAESLFAAKGYDAVSVREIAKLADANIAAINYHFQSKEKLYQTVLKRRLVVKREKILAAVNRVVSDAAGRPQPEALIRTFVRVYLEDALNTSEGETAMRLIARELMEPNHGAETICREMIAPVHREFGGVLVRAMPDPPEERVLMTLGSLIAQVVHFMMRWRAVRPEIVNAHDTDILNRVFPMPSESVESYIEKVIDHITDFSLGGIAAIRRENRP